MSPLLWLRPCLLVVFNSVANWIYFRCLERKHCLSLLLSFPFVIVSYLYYSWRYKWKYYIIIIWLKIEVLMPWLSICIANYAKRIQSAGCVSIYTVCHIHGYVMYIMLVSMLHVSECNLRKKIWSLNSSFLFPHNDSSRFAFCLRPSEIDGDALWYCVADTLRTACADPDLIVNARAADGLDVAGCLSVRQKGKKCRRPLFS